MFGWLKPKPTPEPVNPGAELAKIGHAQRRAAARKLIHDRADAMRAEMRARGMDKPAIDWSAL